MSSATYSALIIQTKPTQSVVAIMNSRISNKARRLGNWRLGLGTHHEASASSVGTRFGWSDKEHAQ